jgi:glycosyltransferase involved in cell wall biosynthesis
MSINNSDRKLVSIVTGTYNRPRELVKCIEQVRNQTYPNIEHVIVHDGPAQQIIEDIIHTTNNNSNVPIRYISTGRQWSHFLANSISAVPYQVAQWLASGDYLCWLADDEEIDPTHIEKLVDLLESRDVDFVYSKTNIWFSPDMRFVFAPCIIGRYPPVNGQITHALYRVELLDYAGFEPHVGSGTDWYQIDAWLKEGASCAMLEEASHTHRVDKLGDADSNKVKQELRGVVNGSKTTILA